MNIKNGVDILYGIDINNILNITAEEGLCLLEDESIDLVIIIITIKYTKNHIKGCSLAKIGTHLFFYAII